MNNNEFEDEFDKLTNRNNELIDISDLLTDIDEKTPKNNDLSLENTSITSEFDEFIKMVEKEEILKKRKKEKKKNEKIPKIIDSDKDNKNINKVPPKKKRKYKKRISTKKKNC